MKESDWIIFSNLVPDLRERRLQRTNQAIASLLSAPDRSGTERFWNAAERIKTEEMLLHDCLDNLNRSHFCDSILLMLRNGMMTEADLQMFSPELRATMLSLNQLKAAG